MDPLPPAYFGELSRQLAFLSAVLGGFAATFFGTLLAIDSPKRVAGIAAASAAIASTCFVCATLTATFIATGLHPEAPARIAAGSASDAARASVALSMMLGLYALFVALGAGGWVRSRAVGITTTVAAVVGAVLTTWAFTI